MIEIIYPPVFMARIKLGNFRKCAATVMQLLHLQNKAITVKICSDAEMQSFNKTYRGIDQTTDVLSFSLDFKEPQSNEDYLGDIIISYQTAKKQAKEHQQSWEDEMIFLLIHGLLHLSGYDHETLSDEKKMFALQDKIFRQVTGKNE